MTKCIKCGIETDIVITPDIDIKGIGVCEEHKEEIRLDIILALYTDDWKRFNKKYNNNAGKR